VRGQADYNPRISGRCRAIAVSPDGRRIYAGSAQGGTWFSADAGEHWLALDFYATTRKLDGVLGEANALAVGSIAVRFGAAADGADDDVYVGTGESKFAFFAPLPLEMQGVGVRFAHGPAPKVAAGGPTADPWTLEATNLAGGAILRLVVDDATGDVWAATTRGLFKRPPSDRQAWEKIDTGLADDQITDVVLTRGEAGGRAGSTSRPPSPRSHSRPPPARTTSRPSRCPSSRFPRARSPTSRWWYSPRAIRPVRPWSTSSPTVHVSGACTPRRRSSSWACPKTSSATSRPTTWRSRSIRRRRT